MKEIGVVYATKDYNRFAMINENRKVDPHNVNRIVHSMREKFLITIALVIREGENLVILDGQHRWTACKFLNLPFYFCIVDDLEQNKMPVDSQTLPELQNTQKWQPADYVHFFAENGNKEYQILQDFMSETGLATIASYICLTGKTGVALPENFKKGGFKVKDLERGYALAKIINELKEGGMNGASNALMVSALFKGLMRHTIDLKKIKQAVKNNLPVVYRLVANSVTATLLNLEAYSHTDRGLQKKHVHFTDPGWPYQIDIEGKVTDEQKNELTDEN